MLVSHRCNKYLQEEGCTEKDESCDTYYGRKKGVTFGRYRNRFVHWHTQTLCTMYLRKYIEEAWSVYPNVLSDGIMSYFILKHGKGYCFNDHMAIYRVNKGGVYSGVSKDKQLLGNLQMYKDYYMFDKSMFSRVSYYTCYLGILGKNRELLHGNNLSISEFFSLILYLPIILVLKLYAYIRWHS